MVYKAVITALAACFVCAAYWWFLLVFAPLTDDGALRVHFLNVGQGDAILIETPKNRQVLVDAGRGIRVLTALDEVLPPHDKSIDVAIMTHPDADHIGGFVPVFQKYEVSTVIRSFIPKDTSVYRKVQEAAKEEGATLHDISKAYTFNLDGVRFDVLWPIGESVKEANAASVIVLAEYGDMKILLTGDAPTAVEERLIALFPKRTDDVDILKIGHHGSKTSTAAEFLKHTKPNAVVYSMGHNNSYGHPHKQVLDTVKTYAANHPKESLKEYRTTDGTISFCLSPHNLTEC